VAATDREAALRRLPVIRDAPAVAAEGAAPRAPAGALIAAALALPGMVPAEAVAQSAPDRGIVELKYLDYRDWQPGADRMSVRNPSLYALMPLSDTLVVQGSLVHESMSGASPVWYNTLSGASGRGITDHRTAGDVKVTKFFGDVAIGVGAAASSERDFLSRAGSLEVRLFSEDRNRTWTFGFAGTNDRINPVNGVVVNAPRNTLDFLVGVTQALSATSIVQSNLTYSRGHGYYSDPYKPLDTRPDRRTVVAWLTRYNLHLPAPDATLQLSYRFAFECARGDVAPDAAARLERRAGPALLHAERRRFLLRPSVSTRLCGGEGLHGRHPPLGIRRAHGVRRVCALVRRGLERRIESGVLPAACGLAIRRQWQSRPRAIFGTVDRGRRFAIVLTALGPPDATLSHAVPGDGVRARAAAVVR
jgi:hypothetical protein